MLRSCSGGFVDRSNLTLTAIGEQMPNDEPRVRRQYRVLKDNGESWFMNYTNAGVRWEPADAPFGASVASPGFGPTLGKAGSPARVLSEVINTATDIGMWWEMRQQRLLSEAMNEETRRISWLAEMVARWGDAHREGDQLDLRVSEYLARETREMMEALVLNKRVALPQSMLYELEMIQDTLRSFRTLILSQFETLFVSPDIELSSAVRNALPHSRLDMSFIRRLGTDPAIEWADRVRTKTTGDFERELTETLRNPSSFLALVFPRTEPEAAHPTEDEKNLGVVHSLLGLLTPALPRLFAPEFKGDGSERRDSFRELSLFPAEVARVRALNSAWLATSAIIEASTGDQVQVQVSDRGVQMELAPNRSVLQLSPS
jgi:hypothetical protein